jgi:anaerobic magnesium-protoporphyrin IX monomethyl ester cyclase
MTIDHKVDVVFIHPGNLHSTYQSLANEYTAIAPPIWTGLLAENIRCAGYRAAIYDCNVEGWSREKTCAFLSKHDPELVVIMVYGHNPSASTQTMPAALRVAEDLHEFASGIPIAMGGLHPTALPRHTLNEARVDYVIKGEGALTIRGLLDYLAGKIGIDRVPGICCRDRKGHILENDPPVPEENLDEMYPAYSWNLLPPLSNYRAHNSHTMQYFSESREKDLSDARSPYATIYTSLGCPFKCFFCCINALFGKSGIRNWSVPRVMEWIDELVLQHGVRHLRIDDELFVLQEKRVERFCELLIDRKYDLNLWAYARVDTIRPTLLKKMKLAGFNWLCLGIETAVDENRRGVNKVLQKDVLETVRMIQENGIYVLGNFMFGLPGDNHESMQATLDLAIQSRCEFVNFYSTVAYPGSPLYNYWIRRQPEVISTNWETFSQHSYETLPLPTEHLTPKEVLAFRDNAFNAYFSNQDYLSMIGRKFGSRAVQHIEKMLKVKLERKILAN